MSERQQSPPVAGFLYGCRLPPKKLKDDLKHIELPLPNGYDSRQKQILLPSLHSGPAQQNNSNSVQEVLKPIVLLRWNHGPERLPGFRIKNEAFLLRVSGPAGYTASSR